jgi:hypothetical protein
VEEVGVWTISDKMSGADFLRLMKKHSREYPASAFPDAVLSSYNPEYSASFLFDAIHDGEWLSFVCEAVDSDIGKMLVKQAFQKFFTHCRVNLWRRCSEASKERNAVVCSSNRFRDDAAG